MKLIPLTRNKHAIVDDADFNYLSQFKWLYMATGYAARRAKTGERRAQTLVWMHREVANCPENMFVDHVNGDGLDNRKENLRSCTASQNQCNVGKKSHGKTSRFKGVSWKARNRKWQAAVCVQRKIQYLGLFDKEEDAAKAYDKGATKLHGEFAQLNFPRKVA